MYRTISIILLQNYCKWNTLRCNIWKVHCIKGLIPPLPPNLYFHRCYQFFNIISLSNSFDSKLFVLFWFGLFFSSFLEVFFFIKKSTLGFMMSLIVIYVRIKIRSLTKNGSFKNTLSSGHKCVVYLIKKKLLIVEN